MEPCDGAIDTILKTLGTPARTIKFAKFSRAVAFAPPANVLRYADAILQTIEVICSFPKSCPLVPLLCSSSESTSYGRRLCRPISWWSTDGGRGYPSYTTEVNAFAPTVAPTFLQHRDQLRKQAACSRTSEDNRLTRIGTKRPTVSRTTSCATKHAARLYDIAPPVCHVHSS